jgi:sensor histidine kinase YesM
MRKLFLLLLALTCFRFSYGEELSPEQKQLAWKFINENLLNKDNQPTIFRYRDQINLYLEGEVTSQDSLVIRDLITNFQRNIPDLKIELSEQKDNLVLKLKGKKDKQPSAMAWDKHTIIFNRLYKPIPDSLTSHQRKQFIYYQLFNGLVSYKKPQQDLPGMNGCVFAETDYKSITFSPLDLFILEKLYAPDFSFLLAQNLNPPLQQTAWNSIRAKFLGETKIPFIYRTDIAIKIKGTVTQLDSACMNELISQLKTIIPNKKIFLTSDKANLVFNFRESAPGLGTSSRRFGKSIQLRHVDLGFAPNTPKEERKRSLYFYLMRSLVDFSPSKTETTGVDGCVFDQKKPESITYHPFDAFILNKLYANDFQEQYKEQYIRHSSYREYLVHRYHDELDTGFFLLALLIVAISITSLIIKGVFKPHNWNRKEFNKQGYYLFAIYGLYTLIISMSDLKLDLRFSLIIIFSMQAFLAIHLIYFIERFLLKNRNIGGSKVVIVFLVTFIVMILSFFWFSVTYSEMDVFSLKSYTHNLTFSNIILISLARSLYIFLNDRYKSIINQKDVELAQMGELHKQAELQSLRAKINPHFLYNALNSIASLATTDAQKTEQMALALSDFFKYAINREQKQLNSLSEELNAVRTYLEIEKVRFGDRLSFEIVCDPGLFNFQIPQLLIQPLVENAIKHGLSQITENGMIRIVITRKEQQLTIRVYDNGPAFTDGPLSGFGIQNTQERIALLYGPDATINWKNTPEKYIELCLPTVYQDLNTKINSKA